MKVLFIALVICAVAFASSVEKEKEKPAVVDKPAENKTVTADKPARDARYYLLASGRVYDRVVDTVVPDVVVSSSRYVVDYPARRSDVFIY